VRGALEAAQAAQTMAVQTQRGQHTSTGAQERVMELSVKLDQSECVVAAVARAEAAEQAVEQAAREARLASLAQRERQEEALVKLHAAQAKAAAAEVKRAEGKRERHFTKHSPSVLFWDISFLIFFFEAKYCFVSH